MNKIIFRSVCLAAAMLVFLTCKAFGESVILTPGKLPKIMVQSPPLSNSVTFSGNCTAEDLSTLRKLPSTVKQLDLSELKIEGDSLPALSLFNTAIENVTLPDGLKRIGDWAFAESELRSITLPALVSELGKGSFYLCDSLKQIKMGTSAVTRIPDECFYGCSSLETAAFPVAVTSVGKESFMKSGLKEVNLPDLDSVEDYAFASMPALTSIVMKQGVNVGQGAFYGDAALTSIAGRPAVAAALSLAGTAVTDNASLPLDGNIGEGALAGYKGENLVLAGTLNGIGAHAFRNAMNLKTVDVTDLGSDIPVTSEDAFSGVDTSKVNLLTAPATSDIWSEHPVWGKFNVLNTSQTNSPQIKEMSPDAISVVIESDAICIYSDKVIDVINVYSSEGEVLEKPRPLCNFAKLKTSRQNGIVVLEIVRGDKRFIKKIMF